MGIFNFNEELANIKNDVSELKRQMEGLLTAQQQKEEPPQEPQAETPADTSLPKTENERKENSDFLNDDLQKLTTELQNLSEKIDTAVYQEGIIRDLHQELQLLKKGLLESIGRGYVMDIINIYERIADTNVRFDPNAEGFDAKSVKRLLENNILYITDLLEDEYSIERFAPASGNEYKPKEQKAVRTIDTDDKAKANTVVECLSAGFRDENTGRILRQSRVVVYKFNINH